MGKIPYKIINHQGKVRILEGKLEINKNIVIISVSHSYLSYSHSRPIPINSSNLVSILMRIALKVWESRITYAHLYNLN